MIERFYLTIMEEFQDGPEVAKRPRRVNNSSNHRIVDWVDEDRVIIALKVTDEEHAAMVAMAGVSETQSPT
jgi:hypothetical protein